MPTAISNALGTQRQFTPQPDRQYQGNYQGIQPTRGVAGDVSRLTTLAESLDKLNRAFQSHAVSHEKWASDIGAVVAERLTAGKSPEEIRTMNTIDAAQNAGIVDPTASRYFEANVEKIRGQQLAVRVKQEYDSEYAMKPARSMQEEQQRYYDYVSDWKNTNLSGDNAPVNPTAFYMGFNENQALNSVKLADAWNKKKYENDITITMANMQSELGEIIQTSPELLKTNGAMTEAVQKVFNDGRLMGLPVAYRMKLLDDFATQIVQTGHIDGTRLEQMFDNVTVQSHLDGTTTKASDLLNMQTYKTYAARFREQYMDKWKYDTIQDFVKKGDVNAVFQAQAWVKENDPDNLPIWNDITRSVVSQIEQKKREEEAERKRILRERMKLQQDGMKKTDTYNTILTWANGGDMYNGRPISAVDIDKDTLYANLMPMLQEAMINNDFYRVDRLMRFPKAQSIRKDIADNLLYSLDNIRLNGDGTVPELDSTTQNYLNFYVENANSAASIFGGDLADRIRMLSSLYQINNGNMQEAVRLFATYNSTDSTTKSDMRSSINAYINKNGTAIPAMMILGDDNVLGESGTVPFYITGSVKMQNAITDLATVYKLQGMSDQQAVNTACQQVQNNFVQYRHAIIPRGAYARLRDYTTDRDDRCYFVRALESVCKKVSEAYTADVTVEYNEDEQMFHFNHPYDKQFNTHRSLAEIRQLAGERFDHDLEWAQNNPKQAEALNVDEINAQRANNSWDEGIQRANQLKMQYPYLIW